jgi:hypothetical protein
VDFDFHRPVHHQIHSFPQPDPAMCGNEQSASQRSWSSADRVILASTALYSQTARLQQSADCRARSKISHTNSSVASPRTDERRQQRFPRPPCQAAGGPIHSTA